MPGGYDQTHKQKQLSYAGKIGGATTKENNSGIFSENWDRSAETKRRWEMGIIDVPREILVEAGKKGGNSAKQNKKGIFSEDWDCSQNTKNIWENLTEEERASRSNKTREGLKKYHQENPEARLNNNFLTWDKEAHFSCMYQRRGNLWKNSYVD